LVEQRIENPRVPGSIPGRGTTYQEALIRNGRGFFVIFALCVWLDVADLHPLITILYRIEFGLWYHSLQENLATKPTFESVLLYLLFTILVLKDDSHKKVN
jgi:hypothetical protein